MVIQSIFPFCFTPELYAARPEYIESLAEFVRSRPMPPVEAFMRQSEAVLRHDATGLLGAVQLRGAWHPGTMAVWKKRLAVLTGS
jgi:hypothetical protein